MTIPERVCVGAVIGAFGINGEIRIKSFCSDPKSIADYDQLTPSQTAKFTKSDKQQLEFSLGRPGDWGWDSWALASHYGIGAVGRDCHLEAMH